jgi:hypothetical protein
MKRGYTVPGDRSNMSETGPPTGMLDPALTSKSVFEFESHGP